MEKLYTILSVVGLLAMGTVAQAEVTNFGRRVPVGYEEPRDMAVTGAGRPVGNNNRFGAAITGQIQPRDDVYFDRTVYAGQIGGQPARASDWMMGMTSRGISDGMPEARPARYRNYQRKTILK